MSKEGNKAIIGAFVVGAIVLAVVGVLAFGSGAFFRDIYRYVMYFDGDLKGLNVGAPVAFRGVRVGQVTDIKVFVEAETLAFSVPVVVEIDPQRFHTTGTVPDDDDDPEETQKHLIEKGMRAQLALQSIVTGQLMIQLDLFPNSPIRLRGSGDMLEIPTIPSSFERLAQALDEISIGHLVDNINKAVNQFGEMLDQHDLENVLSSIQTAASDISMLAKDINQEAVPLVRSLKQTSVQADGLIQNTNRQLDPTLADARATLVATRQAMEQAEKTLQSINSLAEGYTERSAFRYEVSNALREIATAASSLRALTDMLQQQPDALIRGRSSQGDP